MRGAKLNKKELSLTLARLMQEHAETYWSDKPRKKEVGDSKLQKIESHLEDITADVKSNLNALFERGQGFDSLASKSQDLKSHVSELTMTSALVELPAHAGEEDPNVNRANELRCGGELVLMPDAELYRFVLLNLT